VNKVFSIIGIFILTLGFVQAQTKQDSVKLKSGATITKAKYSEKISGVIIRYNTVYMDNSTKALFVISYNRKKNKYERKPLPKNIEID
jgi:hypothetical protein